MFTMKRAPEASTTKTSPTMDTTSPAETPLRYVPGGDAEALRRRLGLDRVIKLASNENPLGPPLASRDAISRAAEDGHIYPECGSESLRRALADRHGLDEEEVLVTCGSTEAIHLVALSVANATPGAGVIAPRESFIAYRIAAQQVGLRTIDVPLRDDRVDLSGLLAAIGPEVGVVFIANPNNPTGTAVDPTLLRRFLQRVPERVLVVLDEAYIEYLAPERRVDAAALVRKHKNLVVLRTFSKAYALAGLRVGYVLGAAATISRLARLTMPFRVSAAAQRAALAALDDELFVARTQLHNRRQRAILSRGLLALGADVTLSETNFVLARFGERTAELAASLRERGIMVRTLDPYGISDGLRVSIGLAEDNQALLRVLDKLLRGGVGSLSEAPTPGRIRAS